MIRMLWIMAVVFYGHGGYADVIQVPAEGFHWYTVKAKKKPINKTVKPVLPVVKSPYERLMEMRKATLNKLAKALLEPSLNATHDYMKAQMVYAKKNQQFVRFWQQVLLAHPELDSTLNFPTDNSAIALRNDAQKDLVNNLLKGNASHYGFIFFYRGKSLVSQKMVQHLIPFIKEYAFSMISVTTDNQPIAGLPHPKAVPLKVIQKHLPMEAKYLPALYLVDLKTNQMSPVSYGFLSLAEIKERIFDVLTAFKRFSFEGVSK